MATVVVDLGLGSKLAQTGSAQLVQIGGTNYPVYGYLFDSGSTEEVYATFKAVNYGSGNLTVKLIWYPDTATSGNVVWGAQIAAITPSVDTQNIETDALATASTVTDAAGAGQYPQEAAITVSNLDSLAADDFVTLRFYRDGGAGPDSVVGDAILIQVTVEYSDT